MIILITGASHTGKTALAQKILEEYQYPYLSIDHLKMGLIRSGYTSLTPLDDDKLTDYLWPVVREMIKTAIENKQNLVVEGCYIPSYWERDFEREYLKDIKFICLVMSEKYMRNNFDTIKKYENVIERRLCSDIDLEETIEENLKYMSQFKNCIIIDEKYEIDVKL